MTGDFLDGTASDAAALATIRAVTEGEFTPIEGARRLSGRWVPAEAIGEPADERVRRPARGESLDGLCQAVIDLNNSGSVAEARRLGELAWILAKSVENRDALVQCAATLAQTMMGDRAATGKRLELLEFAVPEVIRWDRPAAIKAAMLAQLADARFNDAGSEEHKLRATISACQDALRMENELDTVWRYRIHYVAGTVFDELPASESGLRTAVDHLREALRHAPSEEARATTLNNLGNAWRDLGMLTSDEEALRAALDCYDQALPLRRNQRLRRRTEGNRDQAKRALAALGESSSITGEPDDNAVRDLNALIRRGDDALHAAHEEGADGEALRRAAEARYLRAATLLGRGGPPHLRAEVLHRIAGLFLARYDDDSLWTGLCFAKAARRLAAPEWRPVSLARLDSHIGEMLIKIGFPGDSAYLRPAQTLISDAIPLLDAEGEPGEADRGRQLHEMCTSLVAGNG